MNDTINNEILKELRQITKLLVLVAIKGGDRSQREQIESLDKIGFKPREIAHFLGTTPGTVSVALSNIRKKSKKEK